jgi:hypothetical protein
MQHLWKILLNGFQIMAMYINENCNNIYFKESLYTKEITNINVK